MAKKRDPYVQQHYIPKGILKNFCFQANSLWYFDSQERHLGVHRRNRDNVFYESETNTFIRNDGERDYSTETYLDKEYDNRIAPIVNRMLFALQNGSEIRITQDEVDFLKKFIAIGVLRNPVVRPMFFSSLDEGSKRLLSIVDSAYQLLRTFDNTGAALQQMPSDINGWLESTLPAHMTDDVVAPAMSWSLFFIVPQDDAEFVIGNFPISIFEEPFVLDNKSERIMTRELRMVVAPSLAIAMTSPIHDVPVVDLVSVTREFVEVSNLDLAKRSSKIGARQYELLEELSKHM